jgi:hypothetical protein
MTIICLFKDNTNFICLEDEGRGINLPGFEEIYRGNTDNKNADNLVLDLIDIIGSRKKRNFIFHDDFVDFLRANEKVKEFVNALFVRAVTIDVSGVFSR